MDTQLDHLARALWGVWLSFSPYLSLGALLAGLIHVALPRGFVASYLSGQGGVWRAVLFGVPLPLCSCGVIPVGLGLKRDGASDGAAMGFLISTPQTGVDSILVSGVALGWPFAFAKVLAAIVTGLMGGTLIDLGRSEELDEAQRAALVSMSGAHADDETGSALKRLMNHALSVVEPIWGWVLIGVLASALIEVYLPPASLSTLSAYGALGAMGLSLGLSLPLYVCATSSVPIAAALVAKGLPVGAALVFLMAGPATNLATIGAISKALGRRFLLIYLSTITLGAILFGLAFEAFWSAETPQLMAHEHHSPLWQRLIAWATLGLFVWLMIERLARAWRARVILGGASEREGAITFGLTGVSCGGCVRKIERTLGERAEISGVSVSRDPDEVTITGKISKQLARELLEGAGFGVIERSKEPERSCCHHEA